MDPMQMQWLWIALAILVLLIIVVVIARSASKKKRERAREDAEILRTKAHEHDRDLRERAARAEEADAVARRARAEADAKAAEAERLQIEAEKRGEVRDELLTRRDEQLREADRLDPDVRTDKHGRRLDDGRSVADDRAEWDRNSHQHGHAGAAPAAQTDASTDRRDDAADVRRDEVEDRGRHVVGDDEGDARLRSTPTPGEERVAQERFTTPGAGVAGDPPPAAGQADGVVHSDGSDRHEDLRRDDGQGDETRRDDLQGDDAGAENARNEDGLRDRTADDDRAGSTRTVHVYDPNGPSSDEIVAGADGDGTPDQSGGRLHRVDPTPEGDVPPREDRR